MDLARKSDSRAITRGGPRGRSGSDSTEDTGKMSTGPVFVSFCPLVWGLGGGFFRVGLLGLAQRPYQDLLLCYSNIKTENRPYFGV